MAGSILTERERAEITPQFPETVSRLGDELLPSFREALEFSVAAAAGTPFEKLWAAIVTVCPEEYLNRLFPAGFKKPLEAQITGVAASLACDIARHGASDPTASKELLHWLSCCVSFSEQVKDPAYYGTSLEFLALNLNEAGAVLRKHQVLLQRVVAESSQGKDLQAGSTISEQEIAELIEQGPKPFTGDQISEGAEQVHDSYGQAVSHFGTITSRDPQLGNYLPVTEVGVPAGPSGEVLPLKAWAALQTEPETLRALLFHEEPARRLSSLPALSAGQTEIEIAASHSCVCLPCSAAHRVIGVSLLDSEGNEIGIESSVESCVFGGAEVKIPAELSGKVAGIRYRIEHQGLQKRTGLEAVLAPHCRRFSTYLAPADAAFEALLLQEQKLSDRFQGWLQGAAGTFAYNENPDFERFFQCAGRHADAAVAGFKAARCSRLNLHAAVHTQGLGVFACLVSGHCFSQDGKSFQAPGHSQMIAVTERGTEVGDLTCHTRGRRITTSPISAGEWRDIVRRMNQMCAQEIYELAASLRRRTDLAEQQGHGRSDSSPSPREARSAPDGHCFTDSMLNGGGSSLRRQVALGLFAQKFSRVVEEAKASGDGQKVLTALTDAGIFPYGVYRESFRGRTGIGMSPADKAAAALELQVFRETLDFCGHAFLSRASADSKRVALKICGAFDALVSSPAHSMCISPYLYEAFKLHLTLPHSRFASMEPQALVFHISGTAKGLSGAPPREAVPLGEGCGSMLAALRELERRRVALTDEMASELLTRTVESLHKSMTRGGLLGAEKELLTEVGRQLERTLSCGGQAGVERALVEAALTCFSEGFFAALRSEPFSFFLKRDALGEKVNVILAQKVSELPLDPSLPLHLATAFRGLAGLGFTPDLSAHREPLRRVMPVLVGVQAALCMNEANCAINFPCRENPASQIIARALRSVGNYKSGGMLDLLDNIVQHGGISEEELRRLWPPVDEGQVAEAVSNLTRFPGGTSDFYVNPLTLATGTMLSVLSGKDANKAAVAKALFISEDDHFARFAEAFPRQWRQTIRCLEEGSEGKSSGWVAERVTEQLKSRIAFLVQEGRHHIFYRACVELAASQVDPDWSSMCINDSPAVKGSCDAVAELAQSRAPSEHEMEEVLGRCLPQRFIQSSIYQRLSLGEKTALVCSIALSVGTRFTGLEFVPEQVGGAVAVPLRVSPEGRQGAVWGQVYLNLEVSHTLNQKLLWKDMPLGPLIAPYRHRPKAAPFPAGAGSAALRRLLRNDTVEVAAPKEGGLVGRREKPSLQQQAYHATRRYQPGDSPRHILWKVYGRTNQYHVVQGTDEAEDRITKATLFIDLRRLSLGFRGAPSCASSFAEWRGRYRLAQRPRTEADIQLPSFVRESPPLPLPLAQVFHCLYTLRDAGVTTRLVLLAEGHSVLCEDREKMRHNLAKERMGTGRFSDEEFLRDMLVHTDNACEFLRQEPAGAPGATLALDTFPRLESGELALFFLHSLNLRQSTKELESLARRGIRTHLVREGDGSGLS